MALPADKDRPGKIIPWQQRAAGMDSHQEVRKTRGSIHGEAQDIAYLLTKLNIPHRHRLLLARMIKLTYPKAGQLVAKGKDEASCYFNLAEWCVYLAQEAEQDEPFNKSY